jgi:hypothetical protein
MFTAEEDGNLELLTRGPAPRHPTPVYEIALYYPADLPTSSTLGGAPHRFESLCMAAPPLRLDITGTLDRDNYLPVFSWKIELLIFGSNT